MPAPGTLTAWRPPAGPGVRVDEGYLSGMTVPGSFDSLVAKIIVTGADREQALARSRRALAELVIEGMPTVVPFHRAVLDDPAFTAADGHFGVHTRWIETEFTGEIAPYAGPVGEAAEADGAARRSSSRSTASGSRSWCRPASARSTVASTGAAKAKKPVRRAGGAAAAKAPSGQRADLADAGHDRQGRRRRGRRRSQAGDLVVVLEAMKMEQPLTAHRAGTVTGLTAEVGRHRDQRVDPVRDRRLGLSTLVRRLKSVE